MNGEHLPAHQPLVALDDQHGAGGQGALPDGDALADGEEALDPHGRGVTAGIEEDELAGVVAQDGVLVDGHVRLHRAGGDEADRGHARLDEAVRVGDDDADRGHAGELLDLRDNAGDRGLGLQADGIHADTHATLALLEEAEELRGHVDPDLDLVDRDELEDGVPVADPLADLDVLADDGAVEGRLDGHVVEAALGEEDLGLGGG